MRAVFWVFSASFVGLAAAETDSGVSFPAYARSLEAVDAALKRRPEDPRLKLVRARVHFRAGRFEEAARAFRELAGDSRVGGEASMALGSTYESLGRLEDAAAAYRSAAAKGRRAEATVKLAEVEYTRGRFREAAALLEGLIRGGIEAPQVRYLLARSLDALARTEEGTQAEATRKRAVEHLEAALEIEPGHAKARYLLARLLARIGERERARKELEAFRKLPRERSGVDEDRLASAPEEFEARTYVEIARALFQGGDAEGALEFTARALKIRPQDERALALRGWIFLKTRRLDQAEAAYRALLRVDPQSPEALWNLGKIALEKGRLEEAGRLLLEGAERRGTLPGAWELLYELAVGKGIHAGRAEEFARRALRLRPSARNYVRLATALYRAGKLAECESVLKRGLERHPGDPDLEAGLAALGSRAKKGG